MSLNLDEKRQALAQILADMAPVAVAFSGGVDSAYLLAAAHQATGQAIGLTACSPMQAQAEQQDARELAERLGVYHECIQVDTLGIPEIAENGEMRCYYCKHTLFAHLLRRAQALGGYTLVDGSNADDLQTDRPGMRALEELGISSPLRAAGLTKADIRQLSKDMALPTHNKPAFSCLATRIPFGEPLTAEGLAAVEKAEAYLTQLGFVQKRVRVHGPIARIELPVGELVRAAQQAASIEAGLRAFGFSFVTLDLAGYRTGSMNATKRVGQACSTRR